jgi:hypothetical protein
MGPRSYLDDRSDTSTTVYVTCDRRLTPGDLSAICSMVNDRLPTEIDLEGKKLYLELLPRPDQMSDLL